MHISRESNVRITVFSTLALITSFFLRGATERNARFKLRDRDYDSSRPIPRPVRKSRDHKISVLRPISNEIQKALNFFSRRSVGQAVTCKVRL